MGNLYCRPAWIQLFLSGTLDDTKSNEQCILYLLDEQNSIAINHNKFDTEEELDEMHRTILHSMQGEPVEKINVQGKEFEKYLFPWTIR